MSIGNDLFWVIDNAQSAFFTQGELAQLTYGAFDVVARQVEKTDTEVIEISVPIGYRPDKTPLLSTNKYTKELLLERYHHLAFHQLPVNGIAALVTITEATLSDVIRKVVAAFPHKLSGKRTIPLKMVLAAKSISDIHIGATDHLLNELSYKSPRDFAEAITELLGINLLECPAYHRYVEVKATRDVYVHNSGVANDTYVRKSGSHSRIASGHVLPVDIQYFLESYEACLQLNEWLEAQLHSHWHSSEHEAKLARIAAASSSITPASEKANTLFEVVSNPESPESSHEGRDAQLGVAAGGDS